MRAERAIRISLRIAAALAAGFAVSVVVAWVPLVVARRAVPEEARRLQGDLAQAGRATMVKAASVSELDFHAPPDAVAVARSGGLLIAVRLPSFNVPSEVIHPELPSIARWSIDRAGTLGSEQFRRRLPAWIAQDVGHPYSWSTYGAGWPCVLFSACGEPVEDATEKEGAWQRGWLLLNRAPSGEMGRAIPVRLDPRGAVLNSVFYGVILSALMVGWSTLRRRRRSARGLCVSCGYATTAPTCPECGSNPR